MIAEPSPEPPPSARPTSEARSDGLPPLRIPPGVTQLNWLVRYLPVRHLFQGAAARSLLEVGAGPFGLSSVFPGPFVGVDMSFAQRPVPTMIPFRYGGSTLPFQAQAFHTVVSMDTVEHVPPGQRADFLKDLTRVAAQRLVVGFPVDNGGPSADQMVAILHQHLRLPQPLWLTEHQEHGLPRPADIERVLDGLPAWTWRRLPAVGALVNLLNILGDMLVDSRAWIAPLIEKHPEELEAWMQAGCFGPADRHVYLLERRQPAAPVVDLDSSASLVRALACPDCAGAVLGTSPLQFACGDCDRQFALDASGVVPLLPRSVTFVLRPRWQADDWQAAVLAYTRAFGPEQARRLYLEVNPAELPVEAALARLQQALVALGDGACPEIFLADDPTLPPGPGKVVYLPADAGALASCTREWFAARAAAAIAGA
jgi:hypothetical protein